jgi:energy-coupling factor transport system substrate-specific component
MYLYAWPLLGLLAYFNRKKTSALFWSLLSGIFGLFFGAMCAIPYLFISGVSGAFAYWVAGIPYDILHCISNFLFCLVLFQPLKNVLQKYGAKLS